MNIMISTNETIRAYSVNDFCRLCASTDDSMIPIYSGDGAAHMLEKKIKTHLPFIKIRKDDSLPKRICFHCASCILVWTELFENSPGADQKLRNMFENNQYNCKNADYEEMHFPVSDSIEYEEIGIFDKNVKLNKTFNELDKDASTSNTDVLNSEHKSSDSQGSDKLNPVLKSEVFSNDMDGDDSCEDHSVFLNPAEIVEMSSVDCDVMNLSAADDCGGLVPKREYNDDDDDTDDGGAYDSAVAAGTVTINNKRLRAIDADSNAGPDDCVNRRRVTGKDVSGLSAVVLKVSDDENGGGGDVDDPEENVSSCYNNKDEGEEDEDSGGGGGDVAVGDDDEPALEVRQLYVSINANGEEEEEEEAETMCQLCATVFKTRYNLLRHFQKRHPEYKMYECDLCRISFQTVDEFKVHMDEKHSKVNPASRSSVDSKQVRFACDVCGNMYKNKASAMNHLLTHTAKKDVVCPHCDFTCYTKQQLGVHQTKHDKRFECDICSKRFAQKSQLDVHVKAVHYNQRPYCCVLCSKSFKTKGSHDAHMIVHTDTRNYQCPHCEKKCRKRYDLTLHIRTHTGEKPFKCTVCGRGFVQMCDTRKHELLHFRKNKKSSLFFSTTTSSTTNVREDE